MIKLKMPPFHIIIATVIDIFLLPIGLVLTGLYWVHDCFRIKPKFNPKKRNILLLHGSGFNRAEWFLSNYYLRDYNVFSINYAGLLSNNDCDGVDDYAKGKVRDEILAIKKLTGSNNISILGHSMGGLIASYYNENSALTDGVFVDKIISISTPWYGSSFIDKCGLKSKRYKQMSVNSSFLIELRSSIEKNKLMGRLTEYYCVGSESDFIVGHNSALLEDRCKYVTKYVGHYGVIASPCVWRMVLKWLN